jgi:hypothetical protein
VLPNGSHVPHNHIPTTNGNLDDYGASPFGVWGALGTITGGENGSL